MTCLTFASAVVRCSLGALVAGRKGREEDPACKDGVRSVLNSSYFVGSSSPPPLGAFKCDVVTGGGSKRRLSSRGRDDHYDLLAHGHLRQLDWLRDMSSLSCADCLALPISAACTRLPCMQRPSVIAATDCFAVDTLITPPRASARPMHPVSPLV